MVVASPYAVFKAAEQGWPPARPAAQPHPHRPAAALDRTLQPAWSTAIQGELFPLS